MTLERKRFLSSEELDRAAREIVDLARGQQIAAAGGYAMQMYGSDRLTIDLDVLALDPIPTLPELGPLIFDGACGGYQTCAPSGPPVDVIIRTGDFAALYEEALRTAWEHPGAPIRVVCPAYLVAMKMEAGRPKDDLDLMFLLTQASDEERQGIRRIVRRFLGPYGTKDLATRLAEADWLEHRRRL